jgi:hypothetical protein
MNYYPQMWWQRLIRLKYCRDAVIHSIVQEHYPKVALFFDLLRFVTGYYLMGMTIAGDHLQKGYDDFGMCCLNY